MPTTTHPLAVPSPAQHAWQELEIGMFIHFGPATFAQTDYDDGTGPIEQMRLDAFDAEQWCAVAQSLGAKYVIMVAKHVGGFCWWPTATTTYSVKSIPWRDGRGDLVGEVAAACRRRGLGLGIYLSPMDNHLDVGLGGRARDPAKQSAYERIFRTQLEELLTRYGDLCELWFDGSLVFDVSAQCEQLQPGAVRFQGNRATIRWSGNEDGVAPVNGWNAIPAADAATGVATGGSSDPDGTVWVPIEADYSIRRPHWFWRETDLHTLMSPGEIISTWYTSVGRGAQMVFGVCPDTSGAIPLEDTVAVAAAGRELRRRFAAPLAASTTVRELIVGVPCDHVVLEEDLRGGERVRAWSLHAEVDGTWRELAHGLALGRKNVVTFAPLTPARLRLDIERSVGEPVIRRIAAYHTGVGRVAMPEERPGAHWFRLAHHTPSEMVARDHRLSIELSSFCTVAGQWRFTVEPAIAIAEAHLFLDDQQVDVLLRRKAQEPHALEIDLTGIARTSLRLDLRLDPAAVAACSEPFVCPQVARSS